MEVEFLEGRLLGISPAPALSGFAAGAGMWEAGSVVRSLISQP